MTLADKVEWVRAMVGLGFVKKPVPVPAGPLEPGPTAEQVCQSKQQYASRFDAERVAGYRSEACRWRLRVYSCDIGGKVHFHLTKRIQ